MPKVIYTAIRFLSMDLFHFYQLTNGRPSDRMFPFNALYPSR